MQYFVEVFDIDSQLNPHQLDAVKHVGGPLLVLAGAGSGKTRVITYKIAHLVNNCGYRPWEILAVTFTNKAAREMRERTEELLGPQARDVYLGTFHSVCLRILRRFPELVQRTRDFVIYDDDDRERLIGQILKQMGIGKDMLKAKTVGYYVDAQKHRLRGPDHSALPVDNYLDKACAKIYQAYEDAKKQANAFDFGDLIYYTVRLFEKNETVLSEYRYKWRYILVDEFQDTDFAQWKLLKLLTGDRADICVVGDDDQSIYRWRGAEVENILRFPDAFPGKDVHTVRLEQNYRSTGYILEAASALISHNKHRHEKVLWTDKDRGDQLECFEADSEVAEARWVVCQALLRHSRGTKLRDIVVFYRTHAQSRVFEDALRNNSTPYVVVGGLKFYARKEVKDVLAYLKLVQNPRDDVALLRVINTPTRGIGNTTLERARKLAVKRNLCLFDGLLHLANEPEGKRAKKSIEKFGQLITTLRNVANTEQDAFRVTEAVLSETGYLTRLQEEGTHEAMTRKENIEELTLSIEQWRAKNDERSLSSFLDHVSLLTSMDEADDELDAMTLMTIHAAKGLEFDHVFVTGLEENVFPHFNAKEDEDHEEERRLMYVAITRGRQSVALTWARSRQRYGRLDINSPSRFIREVPSSCRTGGTGSSYSGGSLRRGGDGQMGLWAGGSQVVRDQNSGRDYDYADSQIPNDAVDGLTGAVVDHPSFGRGRVARINGQGPNAKVTVQFPGVGTKVVVARFLDFPSSP